MIIHIQDCSHPSAVMICIALIPRHSTRGWSFWCMAGFEVGWVITQVFIQKQIDSFCLCSSIRSVTRIHRTTVEGSMSVSAVQHIRNTTKPFKIQLLLPVFITYH